MALRLQLRLVGSSGNPLIDLAMPPVKGHAEERSATSEIVFTPEGLPLQAWAHFRGDWGDIFVASETTLLLKFGTHVNSLADLLLPTEERVEVGVLNY
jgi:hypothetical protein